MEIRVVLLKYVDYNNQRMNRKGNGGFNMVGVLIFGLLIVFGMLGLLIWVLRRAYSRRDE
jgi:heme/copper-type cytochrome/quinol oxidase subunit 4